MCLKIAIVDDHPLFRSGLNYYLSTNELVEQVLLYSSGESFLHSLRSGLFVDVVFMDLIMPSMSGAEATRAIKDYNDNVKVLAISSLMSVEHIEEMIEAGADGYLLKTAPLEEIDTAIKVITEGKNFFSLQVISILSRRNIRRTLDVKSIAGVISEREMEVLKLFCRGFNKPTIGKMLHISIRTVDKHKENLLEKTNCKNLIQLMNFSLKNGLVAIESDE